VKTEDPSDSPCLPYGRSGRISGVDVRVAEGRRQELGAKRGHIEKPGGGLRNDTSLSLGIRVQPLR